MTALARWLFPDLCPVCGERAQRGCITCGDPVCIRDAPLDPHSPAMALLVGLIGGLLMGVAIGYTIGAGWVP